MIQRKLFALLVCGGDDPFEPLKTALKGQGIEVRNVWIYEEARCLLDQTHPEVIVTAARVGDKTQRDIVRLAEDSREPVNIIVEAEGKSARFYLSAAIDYGVFDFIILSSFETDVKARVARWLRKTLEDERKPRQ